MTKEITEIIEDNALYMIASPIGNLADISLRAIHILQNIDIVCCEDTRKTGMLLKNLNISKKLESCHAHNEKFKSKYIIELIKQGKKIAYVSDAGTPGLSDPGNLLVNQCHQQQIKVIPIPGASALTTLISVCGFNLSKGFFFGGFLPRKKGKLQKLLEENPVLFVFESPYRIQKSLALIAEYAPEAHICLGRELTKKFEEIQHFYIKDLPQIKIKDKGEFVIGIYQK